jgi:stearoyl-CoA desaturase (Delta-9 desaturase)
VHHRYADTPRDPHSPRLRSPLQVLLGSAYLFAIAKRDERKDGPRSVRILLLRTAVVGVYVVVFGAGHVLAMFLVHLVGYLGIMGMVNTVGHLYGRKPHSEASGYDVAWLAIPLLGHGYHNSHHAHPAAARTGTLDPIWPLLRVGAAVGLLELDIRQRATSCCGASASLLAAAGG